MCAYNVSAQLSHDLGACCNKYRFVVQTHSCFRKFRQIHFDISDLFNSASPWSSPNRPEGVKIIQTLTYE